MTDPRQIDTREVLARLHPSYKLLMYSGKAKDVAKLQQMIAKERERMSREQQGIDPDVIDEAWLDRVIKTPQGDNHKEFLTDSETSP